MSDQPSQELTDARACVARLKKAQTTLRLKNQAFVGRYKDPNRTLLLGSARTWERMCADEWEDNKPAKWLPRLKQACAQIEGGTPVEEVFADMPFFKEASAELARLEAQNNDRRILVILASTGTGKSVWGRAQVAEARATRGYVRAQPGWRENGIAICAGMLGCLNGYSKKHNDGYHELLSLLKDFLAANPMSVFLDEAHEGGIELMKIIRYLVDETTSRFIYKGYPTEYQKVVRATTGSLAEARQFIGRALKPIFDDYATGTKPEDVAIVLKHAGLGTEAKVLAKQITPRLVMSEGLRTLDDCLELARQMADKDDAELDGKAIMDALAEVLGVEIQPNRSDELQAQLRS